MGEKKDENQKRIISGTGAVLMIIINILLKSGSDVIIQMIGLWGFVLLAISVSMVGVILLSGIIWPHIVFAPVIAVFNFVKGIKKIAVLPKKHEEMESQIATISTKIQSLSAALPVGSVWLQGLREDGGMRKETLRKIRSVINEILDNKSTTLITDAELARVINETGTEGLYNTNDIEEWDLIFEIRENSYKLSNNYYRFTMKALENTVLERLGKDSNSVTIGNIRAFFELTRNINHWEFYNLFQNYFKQLRYIRATRQFSEEVKSFSGVWYSPCISIQFPDNLGHHRVWKRVWPNDGNSWGGIRCQSDGGFCEVGQLREVSLGGAYCSSCKLDRDDRVGRVELKLPGIEKHINVRDARFSEHHGHFKTDGSRINNGFGIEFLDLCEEDFTRLTMFVKEKTELDKIKIPSNAPWKYPSLKEDKDGEDKKIPIS